MLSNIELPTRKDESWRYTPIDQIDFTAFKAAPANSTLDRLPDEVHSVIGDADGALVFFNGKYLKQLSMTGHHVSLKPLSEVRALAGTKFNLNRSNPELKLLGKWNQSNFNDGYFIEASGQQFKIALVHLYGKEPNAQKQWPYAVHSRNILKVKPNASVDIFELHVAVNDMPIFVNTAVDIDVESQGNANIGQALWFGDEAIFINDQYISVATDGNVHLTHLIQGGKLVRNQLKVDLAGVGAEATNNAIYRADDDQHIDNSSDIRHLKSNTRSRQTYKGILSGKGRGVFAGRLEIIENAQKSDAEQMSRVLLIGEAAEADTKPQLLVAADDVKATHGASIGQLDPDELFYLISRGIDPSEAAAMISLGFERDLLEQIKSSFIKGKMLDIVERSRRGFRMELEQ